MATQARDILQALTAEHPNPEWRRQLAISHDQIGDIHDRWKQPEQALLEYEASRSINEKLSDNWALSLSNYKIGNLLFKQGNHEEALKTFEKALETIQSLRKDPMNIERQRHLLVINHVSGTCCSLKKAI